MRIRTRSLIILFSQGVIQGAALILGVILVRLISQTEFGTYRQVMLVYATVSGLLHLQFESSLYYFVPRLGIDVRRQLLLQTVVGSVATASLVTGGMLLLAGPLAALFNNPELVPLVRIFAVFAIPERINLLIPPFMISVDRAVRAGVYSVLTVVLRMVAVVVTLALGYDLQAVMWAKVAVASGIALVGLFDLIRLSPGAWRFDYRLIVEQFSYCWPLWATTIVAMLNVQFGNGIISTFFEPAMYAVYSCGAIELPVVGLITGSVNNAIMPNLVTLVDGGRRREALALWHQGIRKSSLVILPCFGFFLACASPVIVLLYGKSYELAVWPFSVLLCLLPLRVAYYGSILRAMGQTRSIATAAVMGLAVNAVISLALVVLGRGTLLAFVGPAIGTACAALWVAMSRLRYIGRIVGVSFSRAMPWKELGLLLASALGCGLIVYVIPLPDLPALLDIGIRAAAYAALWIVFLTQAGLLHEDERHLLASPIRLVKQVLSGHVAR